MAGDFDRGRRIMRARSKKQRAAGQTGQAAEAAVSGAGWRARNDRVAVNLPRVSVEL